MMYHPQILGVGSYVPPRVVTNHDLSKIMDTSDEWIQQRTGIVERRWAEGSSTTSDLGLNAAIKALENAKTTAEEIDLIIFATLTPDHEFPGTACFFQAKLGVSGIPAIDVRQQCSGFIYGLSIAEQYIKTGTYRKILLVAAELQSKGLDRSTKGREITILFGDGAGAVVVGRAEDHQKNEINKQSSQIYATCIHADGAFAKDLWISAPSQAAHEDCRINKEDLIQGAHLPKMNGKSVFLQAIKRMPEAIFEVLLKAGFSLQEVDLYVLHQANMRINEVIAKQLNIPEEKIFNTIQKFGNTTSATIPIGLSEAHNEDKLRKGMLVVSAAFGSGFTWASALYRW